MPQNSMNSESKVCRPMSHHTVHWKIPIELRGWWRWSTHRRVLQTVLAAGRISGNSPDQRVCGHVAPVSVPIPGSARRADHLLSQERATANGKEGYVPISQVRIIQSISETLCSEGRFHSGRQTLPVHLDKLQNDCSRLLHIIGESLPFVPQSSDKVSAASRFQHARWQRHHSQASNADVGAFRYH